MASLADQVTVKQHGFHIKPRKLQPTNSDSSSASTVSGPELQAVPSQQAGHAQPAPGKERLDQAELARSGAPQLLPQPRLELLGKATPDGRRLVKEVMQGLRAQQAPVASTEGLGGTYFFKDSWGANVAIIKPCDEEPLAPNNPKGFVGRALGDPGMKPTVRVGEAALREVAAYLLDHDNFAGVPHTVLVNIAHPIFHVNPPKAPPPGPGSLRAPSSWLDPASLSLGGFGSSPVDQAGAQLQPKLASLQGFVTHTGDTSDMGTSQFSIAHVHRIGVLDIRLYNTDRHAGNLLVQPPAAQPEDQRSRQRLQGTLALSPIDHGFCLPEALEPPYFEWLHWPQAMLPFSQGVLDYIDRLDPVADCELLSRELPWLREAALRTLVISTTLLKAGAAAGLTLHEIGSILSRSLVGMEEEPSQLEKLCTAARASMQELPDAMSEVSSVGTISEGIAEVWDEAEEADEAADSLQDYSVEEVELELQFGMDSEGDTSASGDLPTSRLLGMPLPAGRQGSQIPSCMPISPASLSPASPSRLSLRTSDASATTIFSRRSSSPSGRVTGDTGHVVAAAPSRLHEHASHMPSTRPTHITRRPIPPQPAQDAEPMMAKSLAAGAMMHPQGSRSRNRRRRHEAAGRHKPRMGDKDTAPKPPPSVDGAPADPLAGLEPQEWPAFLQCFKELVDRGLAKDKLGLREAALGGLGGRGIIGTSCPAF